MKIKTTFFALITITLVSILALQIYASPYFKVHIKAFDQDACPDTMTGADLDQASQKAINYVFDDTTLKKSETTIAPSGTNVVEVGGALPLILEERTYCGAAVLFHDQTTVNELISSQWNCNYASDATANVVTTDCTVGDNVYAGNWGDPLKSRMELYYDNNIDRCQDYADENDAATDKPDAGATGDLGGTCDSDGDYFCWVGGGEYDTSTGEKDGTSTDGYDGDSGDCCGDDQERVGSTTDPYTNQFGDEIWQVGTTGLCAKGVYYVGVEGDEKDVLCRFWSTFDVANTAPIFNNAIIAENTWTPASCSDPTHTTRAACEGTTSGGCAGAEITDKFRCESVGGTYTHGTCSTTIHTQGYCTDILESLWLSPNCMIGEYKGETKISCENNHLGTWTPGECTITGGITHQTLCESFGGTISSGTCTGAQLTDNTMCTAAGGTYTDGSCDGGLIPWTESDGFSKIYCDDYDATWTSGSCTATQVTSQTLCETSGGTWTEPVAQQTVNTWTPAACSDPSITDEATCTAKINKCCGDDKNYIDNGGFEEATSGIADSWTEDLATGDTGGGMAVVDDSATDTSDDTPFGSSSGLLDYSKSPRAGQTISNILNAKTYVISFFARSAGGGSTVAQVFTKATGKSAVQCGSDFTLSHNWNHYTCSFTTTITTTSNLHFSDGKGILRFDLKNSGTVAYFDEVQLYESGNYDFGSIGSTTSTDVKLCALDFENSANPFGLEWKDATSENLLIYPVHKADTYDVVSDGTKWHNCDNTLTFDSTNTYELSSMTSQTVPQGPGSGTQKIVCSDGFRRYSCTPPAQNEVTSNIENTMDYMDKGDINADLGTALGETETYGNEADHCSDGKDNDEDERIDCLDPDCQAATNCKDNWPTASDFCGSVKNLDNDDYVDGGEMFSGTEWRPASGGNSKTPFYASKDADQDYLDDDFEYAVGLDNTKAQTTEGTNDADAILEPSDYMGDLIATNYGDIRAEQAYCYAGFKSGLFEDCDNDIDDDGDNTVDCEDLDCIGFSECDGGFNEEKYTQTGNYNVINSFACYKLEGSTGDQYLWAECCGGGVCNNINRGGSGSPYNPKTRIFGEGEALATIFDSDIPVETESEISDRVGVFTYGAGADAAEADIPVPNYIDDWSSYTYLEFDMAFNTPMTKIRIDTSTSTGGALAETDLEQYSINGFSIKKWHHFKIPIISLSSTTDIYGIYFINPAPTSTGVSFAIDNVKLTPTKYCSGYIGKRWVTDLDGDDYDNDESYSDAEKGPAYAACIAHSSFDWTGNFCCGDDQVTGSPELYNDENAGCWTGQEVLEGRRVNDSVDETSSKTYLDKIIFINDQFRGCKLPALFTSLTDLDGSTLIDNTYDYCYKMGDYVCSYNNNWASVSKNTDNSDLPSGKFRGTATHDATSAAPYRKQKWNDATDLGCCPKDMCWNGDICVASTSELYSFDSRHAKMFSTESYVHEEYIYDNTFDQYVCSDANADKTGGVVASWVPVYMKEKYDDSADYGYCRRQTDCWDGSECVQDGYYTEGDLDDDHYCYQGAWTTRTKLMASALLHFKPSKYTLYCDDYQNTLTNKPINPNKFEDATTQKVCILKDESTGGKVLTAVALRSSSEDSDDTSDDLGDLDSAFDLKTGHFSNCNSVTSSEGDNDYKACSTDNKVYFNSNTKILVYSDVVVSSSDFIVIYDTQNTWIVNNIVNNINTISDISNYVDSSAGRFSHTNDFDRIFYTNSGEIKVGIRETVDQYKLEDGEEQIHETVKYSAVGSTLDICTTGCDANCNAFSSDCTVGDTYSVKYEPSDDKTLNHWEYFIKNKRQFKMLAFEDKTLTCGANNNLADETEHDFDGTSTEGYCSNYFYPGKVTLTGASEESQKGVPWYCGYDGTWDLALPRTTVDPHGDEYTSNKDRSEFIEQGYSGQSETHINYTKQVAPDRLSEFSTTSDHCCPQIMCWNGKTCVHSEHGIQNNHHNGFDSSASYSYEWDQFTPSSTYDQYVCRNLYETEDMQVDTEKLNVGQWVGVFQKFKWDNSSYGYCESDDQCWTGSFCLNDTQYIDDLGTWSEIGTGDHYCQAGEWTSRTKLVALNILNIATGTRGVNHELLCGPLSDFDENGFSLTPENNICVYRSDITLTNQNIATPNSESDPTYQTTESIIIVGTPLDDDNIEDFFVNTMGIADDDIDITLINQDAVFQETTLESNTNINKVVWNEKDRILLFSDKVISFQGVAPLDKNINSEFQELPVYKSDSNTYGEVTHLNRTFTKDYNRIFINAFTQSVRENPYDSDKDYVSIYYSNIAPYQCIPTGLLDFRCDVNGGIVKLLSSNTEDNDIHIDDLWSELTEKFSRALRCSYDKGYNTSITHPWNYSEIQSREYKAAQGEVPVAESCCPLNTCWDGFNCIASIDQPFTGTIGSNYDHYSNHFGYHENIKPHKTAGYDMYVCFEDTQAYYENIDTLDNSASWVGAYYKEKWDNTSQGYCLNYHDCWNGEECIPAGWYTQFISNMSLPSKYDDSVVSRVDIDEGDHFCEDGNWTTRTKLLADTLLEFTEEQSIEEYTIYCDTPELTLIEKEGFATVPGANTNNFCVLNYPQLYPDVTGSGNQEVTKTLFATSLNSMSDLDEFLAEVDVEDCDSAIEEAHPTSIYGVFKECSEHDGKVKMLWNNKTKLLIYSDDIIFDESEITDAGFVDRFFKNPFRTILDSVLDLFRSKERIYRPITYAKDYDKFYISTEKEGAATRVTYGIMEETLANKNVLTIKYEGFNRNFCDAEIYSYSDLVDCDDTNIDTTITIGGLEAELNPFWRDLTSETRIR